MEEVKDFTKFGRMKAAGDAGELTITFARYNDVDKDNDVFAMNSLFSSKKNVPMAQYQHSLALPVGVGQLKGVTDEGDVIWDGQLDMANPVAADTFRHVKAMGEDQEFSFRFRAKDYSYNEHGGITFKSADVYEVSPVMRGSGNHTTTLEAKAADETAEVVEEPKAAMNPGVSKALAILWDF